MSLSLRAVGLLPCVLSGALLLMSTQAQAQAAPETKSSIAEALFAEGERLAQEGRDLEARDALQRSVWAEERLAALLSLAQIELKLDLLRSALSRLDRIEAQEEELPPAQRARLPALRDAINARFAQLTLQLSPKDALVLVDGDALLGGSERSILLEPGEHEVDVSAAGHKPAYFVVELSAKEQMRRGVLLSPLGGASASDVTEDGDELEEPIDPATAAQRQKVRRRRIAWTVGGALLAGLVIATTVIVAE